MPEPTKPGDGQPDDAAAAAAAAAAKAAESGAQKPTKTFTQEELDAILEARLKRAIPADYEELKALKTAKDAAAEAEKSDLQKAKDEAAAARAEAATVRTGANATLKKAAIMTQATAQGAIDADVVIALLAGDETIEVDKDGNVSGAKEAVKKLLEKKSYLKASTTAPRSGGEFGGADQRPIDERIAELERAGKFAEARDLKIAKGLGVK